MVNDFYMDLLNSIGESKFAAKRCVQCGEVVDSVILLNRQLRQEPMTVRACRTNIVEQLRDGRAMLKVFSTNQGRPGVPKPRGCPMRS